MKTLIAILLSIIVVMGYFMISMYTTLERVTVELHKEQRYSFEMIKACEGHRMYLMNTGLNTLSKVYN